MTPLMGFIFGAASVGLLWFAAWVWRATRRNRSVDDVLLVAFIAAFSVLLLVITVSHTIDLRIGPEGSEVQP